MVHLDQTQKWRGIPTGSPGGPCPRGFWGGDYDPERGPKGVVLEGYCQNFFQGPFGGTEAHGDMMGEIGFQFFFKQPPFRAKGILKKGPNLQTTFVTLFKIKKTLYSMPRGKQGFKLKPFHPRFMWFLNLPKNRFAPDTNRLYPLRCVPLTI